MRRIKRSLCRLHISQSPLVGSLSLIVCRTAHRIDLHKLGRTLGIGFGGSQIGARLQQGSLCGSHLRLINCRINAVKRLPFLHHGAFLKEALLQNAADLRTHFCGLIGRSSTRSFGTHDGVRQFHRLDDDLNGLGCGSGLLLIASLIQAARERRSGKAGRNQHIRRPKFQSHYETPLNAFLNFL